MNSNQKQDLDARLKELEKDVEQQAATEESIKTVYAEVNTDTEEEAELITKVYSWLSTARDKFNNLSSGGKLIVGITAIWLSFTALNFALHLVTNLIVIGILGLILYFAYQKVIVKS